MNFVATPVDDENRGVFVRPLGEEAKALSDVFIGLYEEESDTACGVMALSTVPDESDDSFAFVVREVIIDDAFKDTDAENALYRFLEDLAEISGCSAVIEREFVAEGDPDDRGGFFAGLGFFEEEKKLPLYEFLVSDVKIKKTVTGLGCLNPRDLTDEQWESFVREASIYDFVIAGREYYDPKTSVFLVDDDYNIQAGLLTSIRDNAIFIEGVAAYGSDEGALTNDLIYWVADAARKCHSKETIVYTYISSDRMKTRILSDVTGHKAVKVGNLVSFTFEVPVTTDNFDE